jgi:Tfp pilus assembly protein PilN
MKHATGFALCLAVVVLTGMVTASVGLLLYKEQDVALLQQRIIDLRNENQALRARLAAIGLDEQARAAEGSESPAQP